MAQADLASNNPYEQWGNVVSRSVVRDIVDNPSKTYCNAEHIGDIVFDYAVTKYDDGLLLCYESTNMPDIDPYDYRISDLLTDNTFHQDPIVVITDGDKVLSANEPNLHGMTFDDWQQNGVDIAWDDKLLARVARVLVDAAGEDVLVMRIGGDEFLLVCPHTGDVEAEQLVARAKAGLVAASDEDLTLSVSFGTATVCEGEATFAEAFKAADEAMYVEKQAAHAHEPR